MKILTAPGFRKKYRKIIKKNTQLSSVLDKKFALFFQNPNHPSLKLHKITGKKIEQWSIAVKRNLRILFQYIPEGVLITNIGSHDEVY